MWLGERVRVLLRPDVILLLIYVSAGFPELSITIAGHVVSVVEVMLLFGICTILLRRPRGHLHYVHALVLVVLGVAAVAFLCVPASTSSIKALAGKRLYDIVLACEAFFCGALLVGAVQRASALLRMIVFCAVPIGLLLAALSTPGSAIPGGVYEILHAKLLYALTGADAQIAPFSFYLLSFLAVGLACYMTSPEPRHRLLCGIVTLLITLVLAFAGARSAAFAGAVMMLGALLFMRYYRLTLVVLLIAFLACLFVFHQFPESLALAQSLLGYQLAYWNGMAAYILSHPLLGSGLQPTALLSGRLPMLFGKPVLYNQLMELAIEGGIVWPLAISVFFCSIFIICWRILRNALSHTQRALALSTCLLLLALIIVGLFADPLSSVSVDIVVFLQCGLVLGSVTQKWRRAGRLPTSKPEPSVILPSLQPTLPNAGKTVRAVTFQFIGWIVGGVAMIPATALLMHYLGPVQYGEYSFTLPLLALGALLSGTGMDPLLIRRLSRQPQCAWSETLGYALGARLLSTLAGMLAIMLLVLFLPISMEQRTVLWLGCGTLFFSFSYNGLRTVYTYGFRAEQRFAPLVIIETVSRLLVAVMVAVAMVERLSFIWTYIFITYSDLPCFIALAFIARRRFNIRLRFHWQHIRAYVLGSLSLTGYDALTLLIGHADVLLLMFMLGPFYVGLYALALRISDPLLSITAIYIDGLYPLLCTTFERRREQFAEFYREAVRLTALAVIPPSIIVSLLAGTFVELLGGEHFVLAVIVVQLLMWATAINCFSQLAARSCMAANLERFIPYVSGLSALCNIVGNLLAIPRWQVMGAGVVSIASELLALVLFVFLLRKYIYPWRTLSIVLQVGLAMLPTAAFLLWQPHFPLLVTILLVCILMLCGCYITRTLRWRDAVIIWRFLFMHSLDGNRDRSYDTLDITDYPTLLLPVWWDNVD
jgi:O-antigen/teichoic acid export membrane protein